LTASASTEATFEYLPALVSVCSHVQVVDSPLASLLAPPARFVQLASVKEERISSLSPVFLTTIS
jgi:hypothetical protein